MRVIYHRGRCMERAAPGGRMLAAGLTPAEAVQLAEKYNGALSSGRFNGPASVTLSGDAEAIAEAAAALDARQVFNRPVPVNYAFHSARMDPVREELVAALRDIRPRAGRVPIYSTVTGGRAGGRTFHAAYWWRNVRLPVLFGPAIEELIEDKHNLFLEIAPHPVLSASIRETAQNQGAAVFHSLRRKADEQLTMLETLGGLHNHGCPVDWRAIYPHGRFVRLPLYPWQRQRHWHESMECGNALRHPPHHPLLNRRLDSADPAWTVRLDQS